MPARYTVTVSRMGGSRVIVIPKPIVEGFGLEIGQKVEMIATDEGIHVSLDAHGKTREQKVGKPKART